MMTSKQIQEKTGATRLQIVRWAELGLVKPIIRHRGRGTANEFDEKSLEIFKFLKKLSDVGIGTKTMEKVIKGEIEVKICQ